MAAGEQYPRIRALTRCLACGGPKSVGLLVCWQCHNEFSMLHDKGYGPSMDRVLDKSEAMLNAHGIVKKEPGTAR